MTAQRRSGYASEDDYPIKCPHCLNEFTIKVADIEAGSEVRCPEKSWGKVERNPTWLVSDLAKARKGSRDPWLPMLQIRRRRNMPLGIVTRKTLNRAGLNSVSIESCLWALFIILQSEKVILSLYVVEPDK